MHYASLELAKYISDAASGQPTPGGGSVSGLVGALAAAMSEMAANFTSGKKKFAAVEKEVCAGIQTLQACRERLLDLMQQDVEAYSAVGAAYAMPKECKEDKAARARAIQDALRAAMAVPLGVMEQCARVAAINERLAVIANPNLITDVGVSAILAEAACASARLNVEVNLKYMKDEKVAEELLPRLDAFSRQTQSARRVVAERVRQHLSG